MIPSVRNRKVQMYERFEKVKCIPVLFVLIYLVIILYITLFCRSSGLLRSCKLEPFYSYIVWYRSGFVWNRQLLFNIALFVPLGYFLINALQRWNKKNRNAVGWN